MFYAPCIPIPYWSHFIAEGQAAYARSVCDLLFGMNLTRFYTLASGGELLSIGRVQTPTLGLIVNRDEAIENHKKQFYYQLVITVKGKTGAEITLQYVMTDTDKQHDFVNDKGQVTNPDFYRGITGAILGQSGILHIQHTTEKQSAPLPFNLTKLQTTANKAFGFSTAKTLKITQSLRDKHKAITYNRTDCQYLNDEHFNDAPELIEQIQQNLARTFSNLSTDSKPRCFNSKNVTAHHAIIPTLTAVALSDLSADEAKIYELIATYYLIQFMPPALIKKSTATITLDKYDFMAHASQVTTPSWQALIKDKDTATAELISKIPQGDYPATLTAHEIAQKETKPPPRYTEASLTTDMTAVAKYCSNPKIKQALIAKDDGKKGENGSIGTVATRADIIEKLISRGFVARKKKQLISTPLGRQFYHFLPHNVKSIDITAYWWLIQEDIKAGHKTADDLIHAVYRTVASVIDQGTDCVPAFNFPKTAKPKKTKSSRKPKKTRRNHAQ